MQGSRIFALMLRYALEAKWNFGRQLLILYFPAIDVILYGFMGKWFSQLQSTTQTNFLMLYLTMRVCWSASTAIYQEMAGDFQIEIEALNIVSLFSSPISLFEWFTATTINGVIRGLVIFLYGAILSLLIFGVNIFSMGTIIIPFTILLLFSWLPMGIIICALYLHYGTNSLFIRWTLPSLVLFLSAVYYPLNMLPSWIAPISRLLPTTHLFLAIQKMVLYHTVDIYACMTCALLIIIYTILGSFYLIRCFNWSKKIGLSMLEHI